MTILLTGCDYSGKTYFLATLICLAKQKKSALFEPDCNNMQANIEIDENSHSAQVDTLYIKNCLSKDNHHINVDMVQLWKKKDIKFSFKYKDVSITFIRVPEKIYENDYYDLDSYFLSADGMLFFIDGISLFVEYTKQIQKNLNICYSPHQVYEYLNKNHFILLNIIYYWKQFSRSFFKNAIIFSKSDCFDLEINDHKQFKPRLNHLDKKIQDHFLSFIYNIQGCFPETHFFNCASYGAKTMQKNEQNINTYNIMQILEFLISNQHGGKNEKPDS